MGGLLGALVLNIGLGSLSAAPPALPAIAPPALPSSFAASVATAPSTSGVFSADPHLAVPYFGARYYGSRIGRFTTVDPALNMKASFLNPQRWNRYAYGLNNPLRFIDPDGREVPVVVDGRMYNMGTEVLPSGTVAQGNQAFAVLLGVATLGVPDPTDLAFAALGRWAGGTRAGVRVLNSVGAAVNRTLDVLPVQLQSKFKHAADFGVTGNYSKETAVQFEQALRSHVGADSTKAIQGTYRGQDVTHFINPETGLNVMRDKQGGFVSGWKLSEAQQKHVLSTGKLGGD